MSYSVVKKKKMLHMRGALFIHVGRGISEENRCVSTAQVMVVDTGV